MSSYIFETACTEVCVSLVICSTTLSSLDLVTFVSHSEAVRGRSGYASDILRGTRRAFFRLAFSCKSKLTQIKVDRCGKLHGRGNQPTAASVPNWGGI